MANVHKQKLFQESSKWKIDFVEKAEMEAQAFEYFF